MVGMTRFFPLETGKTALVMYILDVKHVLQQMRNSQRAITIRKEFDMNPH